MTTKKKLLDHLREHLSQWVSGEQISNQLGISRTAIWKQINRLKSDGHEIDSAPKKGYRLTTEADLMTIDTIQAQLQTRVMGQPAIHLFQETDSTNLQAKILAGQGAAEGTVVVADTQSHGRGRRGRTWLSPPGRNIYTSLILRPPMAPFQAPQITLMTAVAVTQSLNRTTGLDAKIKWPNDILIQGKKVAGILTEISTEMDVVDFVVVGLGINVNTRREEMLPEIQDIATSIHIEGGDNVSRPSLLCNLLKNFETCYDQLKEEGFGPIMNQWRTMTDIIGQRVYVDVLDTRHIGTVEAVDDDGVLILKDDQAKNHRIFSGDVTRVRPKT
jgi:BirA family transcriptional regulator, biotin operon repressor / biotin---[acetyl-CoA-carboxylase] ligase